MEDENGDPSRSRGGMAFARSWQAATVARFSSSVITRQEPISCNVRRHPMHRPVTLSIVQTLMQGEVTPLSFSVIAPEVRFPAFTGKP